MNLGRDKTISDIISRLRTAKSDERAVKVEGAWGSFAPLLASYISEKIARPILYISPHIDDADKVADDLRTFGGEKIELLPAWEGEEELADATDEIRAERLKLVLRRSSILRSNPDLPAFAKPVSVGKGRSGASSLRSRNYFGGVGTAKDESLVTRNAGQREQFIIAASVQALCQPIPKPEVIEQTCLQLEVGGKLSPEEAAAWLVENGFERVEKVDLPGQFACRGGIVDIYPPLTIGKLFPGEQNEMQSLADPVRSKAPEVAVSLSARTSNGAKAVRVEFFGDNIESIREINLDTQRSTQQIQNISIVSAVQGTTPEERELFLNILPPETIIIFEEPSTIQEVADVYLNRVEDAARLYSWTDIYKAAANFVQLHICRFATEADDFLKVDVKSVQQFQHKATSLWAGSKKAIEELVGEAKGGKEVLLYCESSAELKRVGEIIKQINGEIPTNFELLLGFINQGFVIDSLNTIVISHHELFGQYAVRRRMRPVWATSPVDTLSDLQEGDYVVHTLYGIGKFLGVETIQEKGGANEYLTIEYADSAKIQVSVRNIALVQKYIGTSPKRPKLSKVGSKRWQKQKEKVTASVQNLAAELLEIQAKRLATGGIAFGEDSNWQIEFEESFPYQETPDQISTAGEIKGDMQRPMAMDRLLCGDVGYGKTELGMRAAFKAVENGKQVAILAPTTVLCVQHGRTFTERFADFPVCIEILNRFKTPREAVDIIERTKQGKVDILIGTHRLLSGDIGFKDLGLLIIDEEQRFGVEHKERLKKLRTNVDILTMTATPIPRTLHISLLGLRDISSLATPPLDRRSIVTTVTAYNDELIKKAVIREMNRQGQVFFLHNRVKTIEKKAWEIQKLVSDARVAIAHGQMSKHELERTMIEFVLGRIDVLVCTTIVESGLDIPNANTIFINDADRFGLAELHQLRGRVGRYKHRAFAYMLLPKSRPITPLAAKRLKAIEEYSHLGAGFKIALRDLEIRGAGNILGSEQSGHIQTVGYQMYCELLADAVKRLKNEPMEPIPTAVVDLGFATYIPKNYIPADRQRMDIYRKIAVARCDEDLRQLESELADVYGPVPEEVKLLLDLAEIRIKASKCDIKSIVVSGQELIFSFGKEIDVKSESLFSKIRGKVRMPEPKTVYLRLPVNYFGPKTLISILRKMFNR